MSTEKNTKREGLDGAVAMFALTFLLMFMITSLYTTTFMPPSPATLMVAAVVAAAASALITYIVQNAAPDDRTPSLSAFFGPRFPRSPSPGSTRPHS